MICSVNYLLFSPCSSEKTSLMGLACEAKRACEVKLHGCGSHRKGQSGRLSTKASVGLVAKPT